MWRRFIRVSVIWSRPHCGATQGQFERFELPGTEAVAGRGVAFGDLNNDGSMDAVMAVLGGRPQVFMNRAAKPGAMSGAMLRLVGTKSNRDGVGARVRAGEQWVYATGAGSYLSASDTRLHIAGAAKDVEIVWPSGRRQIVSEAAAGRVTMIKEVE